MNFADITNDIAFRKIFENSSKKISLISFLNAVIDLPQNDQIIDVEIINPYQLGKLSRAFNHRQNTTTLNFSNH